MTRLNNVQLKLFKSLIITSCDTDVNVNKIDKLRRLPEFRACKNILKQITKNHTFLDKNKTRESILESDLQDILIEYTNKHGRVISDTKINQVIGNYLHYLENDQDKIFYFSPLYNLEFKGNELIIDDSIKIRKITESEKKYLTEYYNNMAPILLAIRQVSHVFVIKIPKNVDNPKNIARKKAIQTINKFTLIKKGDIYLGGMYAIKKSECWTPQQKFDKIILEPIDTYSQHKYILQNKTHNKFQTLLRQINKRYPTSSNIESEKYDDYFDRIIRRFNASLTNKDESEKIVDLVLALEILLVSSSGENTLRLSQRTALFIGINDKEKLLIWNYMKSFYNFRSGQVHEFKDKKIKIKNSIPISKKIALEKLYDWSRRAIIQMILFSQENDNYELSLQDLYHKIDESMFDQELNTKITGLAKKTRMLLDC